MSTIDLLAEEVENFEQKCHCVFVLDVSGSMSGDPILDLNKALQDFYHDIEQDWIARERIEVSLITFGNSVKIIQEPTLTYNSKSQVLEAEYGGGTMVEAVYEAIDLVAARKQWYKSKNLPYYRPWIILITDGEPFPNEDIPALAQRIKQDTENKKYTFLPIGVDNANMSVLQQIQGRVPAMKLKGTRFSSFIMFIDIDYYADDESVNKKDDWELNFKI